MAKIIKTKFVVVSVYPQKLHDTDTGETKTMHVSVGLQAMKCEEGKELWPDAADGRILLTVYEPKGFEVFKEGQRVSIDFVIEE